jgi:hypothetical protein
MINTPIQSRTGLNFTLSAYFLPISNPYGIKQCELTILLVTRQPFPKVVKVKSCIQEVIKKSYGKQEFIFIRFEPSPISKKELL